MKVLSIFVWWDLYKMRQIDLELNMLFVNVFTDVYKYEFLALIYVMIWWKTKFFQYLTHKIPTK